MKKLGRAMKTILEIGSTAVSAKQQAVSFLIPEVILFIMLGLVSFPEKMGETKQEQKHLYLTVLEEKIMATTMSYRSALLALYSEFEEKFLKQNTSSRKKQW